MDFFCGVIGLVLFEAIRIYKRLWAGLSIPPLDNRGFYLITIFTMILLSGFLAEFFANGNQLLSVYIGFSVPTGAKAIFEMPPHPPHRKDQIDDIDYKEVGQIRNWVLIFKEYFKFF